MMTTPNAARISEVMRRLRDRDANVRYEALQQLAALDADEASRRVGETHVIPPLRLRNEGEWPIVRLPDGREFPVSADGAPPGMVFIPGGAFARGDDGFPENPRRTEQTDGFWVDIFPVTNAEFEAIFPEHRARRSQFAPHDDSPVVNVSWEEATAYCQKLGKRLMGEAEWEKVAGGPAGLRYPYGDRYDGAKARTGLDVNAGTARLNTVYWESVSGYGVFDLSGNIWEWTSSWHDATERRRVLKGGCWSSGARHCCNAYRLGELPHFRYVNLGFRCACDG